MPDLEQSIADWRRTLAPSLSPDHLDELESHLRDALPDLQRDAHLSPDEALLVATHRLGHPAALRLEYAKNDPSSLWRDRLLWMLTGLLAFQAALAAGRLVSNLSLLATATLGLRAPLLPAAATLTTLLGYAATASLALYAWRRARQGHHFGSTRWIVGIAAFLILQHVAAQLTTILSARVVTPQDFGTLVVAKTLTTAAFALLLPILLCTTLLRLRPQPT